MAAKRDLCATDNGYFATLSPASVQSLHLQGGPITSEELEQFISISVFKDAIHLRLWDDRAKVQGLTARRLEVCRERVDRLARSS